MVRMSRKTLTTREEDPDRVGSAAAPPARAAISSAAKATEYTTARGTRATGRWT